MSVVRGSIYLYNYLSICAARFLIAYVSYLSIYRSNIFNEKLQTDLETGLLALACTISYIFKELEKFEIGIYRVLTVQGALGKVNVHVEDLAVELLGTEELSA